jgi:hypothetical protein
MPYIANIQSRVNHTDACSSGNKEAGLVNGWEHARIPRNILKSKTPTGLLFSVNGSANLQCCSANQSGGCRPYVNPRGRNNTAV